MLKKYLIILATTATVVLASVSPIAAQTSLPTTDTLEISVKKGQLVRLPAPASNVFIANPDIADVQVASPTSVFVLGLAAGSTTLYALGADDAVIFSAEVQVGQPLDEIQRLIGIEYPDVRVRLHSTPNGVVVTGRVESGSVAEGIITLTSQFLGEDDSILNRLSVTAPTQVNLRVRVAEMSRQVTKELGVNFAGIGQIGNLSVTALTGRQLLSSAGSFLGNPSPDLFGSFGGRFNNGNLDVTSLIDALEREGVVTTLAEPNLTALSGETASFLAGGEFPIPVAQSDDNITIEFKQFGVAIDFTPTVLSPERISMRVRPEVSELTDEGAIQIGDIRIPALSVRRTETTVELGSGQSFAIAGLLQNNTKTTVSQLPGLGSLPILGRLFRSDRFQRDETELVIIVTPYLVQPSSANDLPTPLDGFRPASDLERIFTGKLVKESERTGSAGAVGANGVRLLGDAGFTY